MSICGAGAVHPMICHSGIAEGKVWNPCTPASFFGSWTVFLISELAGFARAPE
jgi:hypothetical protein